MSKPPVRRSFLTPLELALVELGAAVLIAVLIWSIGVFGLELVTLEGNAIVASGISRNYLLLGAPIFLGVTSYLLVIWSKGFKGPGDLAALLTNEAFQFVGWVKATGTWIVACIELGTGLSPKGFEGPYIASSGGLSGEISQRLSTARKHLNLNDDFHRRLARCGLGVAFGVLFRTPLGGLVCTFEFAGFEGKNFWKQLPSALVATAVSFTLVHVTNLPVPFTVLSMPSTLTVHQILILCLVGIFSGIVALFYVYLIQRSKGIFGALEKTSQRRFTSKIFAPVMASTIPVIGAAVSTALGAVFFIILGSNDISRIFVQAPVVPVVLIGAIIAKAVATASADGSKCAGGTVGPAILLGGLVGRLIGGLEPMYIATGSAALLGPIAGLSVTMLLTSATWLGLTPLTFVMILPIVLSWVIRQSTARIVKNRIELYPHTLSPTINSSHLGQQAIVIEGLPATQPRIGIVQDSIPYDGQEQEIWQDQALL